MVVAVLFAGREVAVETWVFDLEEWLLVLLLDLDCDFDLLVWVEDFPVDVLVPDFRHVLVWAANSVVDALGLKSPRSTPPRSAPTSTNTPALMLSSADTGTSHVVEGNDAFSLRITSGIEMYAPAKAFASTTLRSGNCTPAWTLTRRATVTSAGTSTVRGRRVAEEPSL